MADKLPEAFDWKSFPSEDSPKTPQDLGTPNISQGDDSDDFSGKIQDYSGGTEKDTGKMCHLAAATKENQLR